MSHSDSVTSCVLADSVLCQGFMNYKYFCTNIVVCDWLMDYVKCMTLDGAVGIVVLDAIIFSHCFGSGAFVYVHF